MEQVRETISSPEDDAKLQQYTQQLNDLRQDGVNKVLTLEQDIATTKKSKIISAEEKQKLIANFRIQLEAAHKIAAANKAQEQQIDPQAGGSRHRGGPCGAFHGGSRYRHHGL